MPKSWKIQRKGITFISKPNSGSYMRKYVISVLVLLRDILGVAKTSKEAKFIVNNKTVLINGKQTKLTANLEGLLQYESTRNSMIGAWDSAGYEFDGTIDDVRIWNRALTLAEMRMPNYSHNPYELTIEYANISPGIHEYQAHAIDMTGNAINTERIMFDVEEGHGIVFNFSTKTSISN